MGSFQKPKLIHDNHENDSLRSMAVLVGRAK